MKKEKRRFNWLLSDVLRTGLKAWYETKARLTGQAFYCEALHGESDYNITVNSDLTVSCNCQDYDGSGHLGDLKKDSFDKVFFGPVATDFRENSPAAKFPSMPARAAAICGASPNPKSPTIFLPRQPRKMLPRPGPTLPRLSAVPRIFRPCACRTAGCCWRTR